MAGQLQRFIGSPVAGALLTTLLLIAVSVSPAAAAATASATASVAPASAAPSAQAATSQAVTAGRFELHVPVLYYHHILCPPADATIPSLYECPDQFTAQLSYLHDQGWSTITVDRLADLVAQHQCPSSRVFVISIDDGSVDGYDNAAPIMESLGMHGSFFVTSGVVGGLRPGKISWDQLRDLIARGHAIGNHTETHLNLKVQPQDVLYDQIEGAQQIFDTQLGFRPRTFAYPYGRYNDSVIAQVASSGFELAFTVHAGAREASDAPYTAKRIEVDSDATGADVLAKLAPFADACQPGTPDLSFGLTSAGPMKGDNILATSPGPRQTIKRTGVKAGHLYRFWVRLDNDAQTAAAFSITPTIGGTAGMDVHYQINGVDKTIALASGTYVTPVLQPWSSMILVVRVTPLHAGLAGDFTQVDLRAVSSVDPSRIDAGRAIAAY